MKNTRLKNVIFTAGMAVFTGVLLLGVNAAIGAATPTVDPPGAGVSPTFTGLDVTGNIENSAGSVSVSDNLAVTGNVTATGSVSAISNLNASGNVSAEGNLNVSGNAGISGDANISGNLATKEIIAQGIELTDWFLGNGGGYFSFLNIGGSLGVGGSIRSYDDAASDADGENIDDEPVTIYDDLRITGQVEVNNDIVHGEPGEFVTVNGPFEATDLVNIGNNVMIQNDSDITVTGDADILGDLNVSGDIGHPTPGEPVTVVDDFDVYGSIKNTSTSPTAFTLIELTPPLPRPVKIDDRLEVTGISTFSKTIYAKDDIDAEGKILNIADDGKGGTLPVAIHDALTVKDAATFSSNVNVNGDLTALGNVYFSSGDLAVGEDVSVVGAVTASRFGTYTRRVSNAVTIPDQMDDENNDFEHRQASKSCNPGEILVSCGGYASGSSASYSWTRWVIFDKIESNGNTCYLEGTNINTFANQDRYITAVAMCLDPDL